MSCWDPEPVYCCKCKKFLYSKSFRWSSYEPVCCQECQNEIDKSKAMEEELDEYKEKIFNLIAQVQKLGPYFVCPESLKILTIPKDEEYVFCDVCERDHFIGH